MNDWKLEIQESEKLVSKGILCMICGNGKKLYVKVKAHKGDFLELVPLSIVELKENGIEIEESCLNYDFDVEIQESEFTNEEVQRRFEEERRKRGLNVPLNTPESAQKAIEIATKAKEILERKSENPETLKEENEDLKAKLELIASRELEKRIKGYSEELKVIFRNDPSKLIGYELAKKENNSSESPSGSAPLNDKQMYGQIKEQSFNSEKEMIDYLRQNKTPENEAILKKLFEKAVQGIVEKGSWVLPFENVNSKTNENDSNVKSVEVNINSVKEGESEIEKWTKKKKRVEQ